MVNISKIFTIKKIERFLDQFEIHLLKADKEDVKSALEIASYRRTDANLSSSGGFSKDKEILSKGTMPKSVFFGQGFDNLPLNTMPKEEKSLFWDRFYNRYRKLKNTHTSYK